MFKFKISKEINLLEAVGIIVSIVFSILAYINSVNNTNYAINKDIEEKKE